VVGFQTQGGLEYGGDLSILFPQVVRQPRAGPTSSNRGLWRWIPQKNTWFKLTKPLNCCTSARCRKERRDAYRRVYHRKLLKNPQYAQERIENRITFLMRSQKWEVEALEMREFHEFREILE
jgi:hypothetical protein